MKKFNLLEILKGQKFWHEITRYLLIFFVAILASSVFILFQGKNPIFALYILLREALLNKYGILRTIRWATPEIISGLAGAVSFRAGVFNIGLEGQLYFGGLAAAIVGYSITNLPAYIHIPVCLLAGAIAGGLFVALPAFLLLYYGINEIVSTLMLNYIAIFFCDYLVRNFLMLASYHGGQVPSVPNEVATPEIANSARLPYLFGIPSGFLIGLALCIIFFLYYKKTVRGYEADIVGLNKRFAAFSGIPATKTAFFAFIISGMIAGLSGAIEIIGAQHLFRSGFSASFGWDGVLVATIAKSNPIGVIFAGFFMGALKNGAMALERATSISRMIVVIIEGIFILFVTARFTLKYFVRRKKKEEG